MLSKSERNKIGAFFGLVFVIVLFVFMSYLVQNNLDSFREVIGEGFGISGMVAYVFIMIAAIVVAPVSAMPLLPLASGVWGWFLAGVLSIIGWTIGAVIAFLLAKTYGVPLVNKLFSMEKIQAIENKIPEENLFLSVVFLRNVLPVDIISYALGLFTDMDLRSYTLATLIGVTPFAFIFAYVGTVSIWYQLVALALALAMILIGLKYIVKDRRGKKSRKRE